MKSSTCTVCLAGALAWLLTACGGAPKPEAGEGAAPKEAKAEKGGSAGLTLDAGQREKIGITTAAAAAASFIAESPGYGVVVGHEPIAVASAELATAQAAVRQSRAALARAKQLAGTPAALSSEVAEAAERQAEADATALALAERRLTAVLGQDATRNAAVAALVAELATGHVLLVRATFPLGALGSSLPRRLQFARLDAGGAPSWSSETVWDAPADASIPGRTLFAALRNAEPSEGERLQVWASAGASAKGAVVPESAVVQSNGAYWCYVEQPAGSFTRKPVDTSRRVQGGYFVSEGLAPGTIIVTGGAGLLLARETNPATEAEE